MNFRRKIITLALAFSLAFTFSVPSATAAVGSDTTAPVLHSMEIVNPQVTNGNKEYLYVDFDVTEDESGVDSINALVQNIETRQQYSLTRDNYETLFTGKTRVEFNMNQLPGGTYRFAEISIQDTYNNTFDLYDYSDGGVIKPANSFTVTDTWSDILQPINSIEITENKVDAQGILNFTLSLGKTKKHPVRNITLWLTGQRNGDVVKVMTPDIGKTSGKYSIDVVLDKYNLRNDTYKVTQVVVQYQAGYTRSITYTPDKFMSADDMNITSYGSKIVEDYDMPEIVEIEMDITNASIPGSINADITLKEEGTGVKNITLCFRDPATGNTFSTTSKIGEAYNEPVLSGTYSCGFPVYFSKSPGTYEAYEAYITDNFGNGTVYNKSTGTLDSDVIVTIDYLMPDVAWLMDVDNPELLTSINNMTEGQTAIVDITNNPSAGSEIFEAAAGKNVTLVFDWYSEYQWIINGMDIDPSKCKDISMSVHNFLADGYANGFSTADKVLCVSFPSNGELPGKMIFRLQTSYIFAKSGISSESMKLYYLDGDLSEIEDPEVIITEDKALEFEITHNSDFAITDEDLSLGKVKNLKARGTGKNTIKLSWTKNQAATGYYIYRSTSKDGTYKRIGKTTKSSYTDKKLTYGKKYYYKVKPYNNESKAINKTASYSKVVTGKTGLKYPNLYSVSRSYSDKIKVKWEKVSGAKKYYVYRADSKNGTYKKIATTTKLYYNDKNVRAGKSYYYKIKAVHPSYSKYNSDYSDSRSGTLAGGKGTVSKI